MTFLQNLADVDHFVFEGFRSKFHGQRMELVLGLGCLVDVLLEAMVNRRFMRLEEDLVVFLERFLESKVALRRALELVGRIDLLDHLCLTQVDLRDL